MQWKHWGVYVNSISFYDTGHVIGCQWLAVLQCRDVEHLGVLMQAPLFYYSQFADPRQNRQWRVGGGLQRAAGK